MNDLKITGLHIYYYIVCKRKLWFFCHNLSMEQDNQDVAIGKYVDEHSYTKHRKHLMINQEINLDYMEPDGKIHEIKKSRSIEEASIWQVKYYLYYLMKRGVKNITAEIEYPLRKETVVVELDAGDQKEIENMIEEIKQIAQGDLVHQAPMNRCAKCAYYDLCMI